MTARISHTTIDSIDAHAQSVFWARVLGFSQEPGDPNEPGDEECMIVSPDGAQRLLFIEVPDAKKVKNRLHLDLVPVTGTRDEELARLLEIGARQVEDLRDPDGTGWVVLADPEGNEFCILRGDAERAEGRAAGLLSIAEPTSVPGSSGEAAVVSPTDPPRDGIVGVVRVWHRDDGWGVVDSPQTPGGCWVHLGVVDMPAHRELRAGQQVLLEVEDADQDGYAYRATRVEPFQEGHPGG
jgi:cold shock CspA family protein